MFSRLFVRVRSHVRPGQIRAGEPSPPAKRGICEHRFADASNRGRMCPECGLPMIHVPSGAR